MTVLQALSDLNVQVEIARDHAEEANKAFREARDRFQNLERFSNETQITGGEIKVINTEGNGNSCTILTNYYRLDGVVVQFTITEARASNHETTYIGHIFDFAEKTVVFACQFYCENFDDKQDLFDRLLVNYAEWRFDL